MTNYKVGNYRDVPVYRDFENAANDHVLVVGRSGCGKTVCCQNIIRQIAEGGGRVLIIDMHGSLSDDQIFEPYRESFNKYRHDIDAAVGGIPCRLFTPLVTPKGNLEDPLDTAGAVADIFTRAAKLSLRKSSVMRKACEAVMESGAYSSEGIAAIGEALIKQDSRDSTDLYELLHHIFRRNALIDGESLFSEGINILHLSEFDLGTQAFLAEIILSYIWRMAVANQFKERNLYLFLDEAQNFNHDEKSPLAQAISEGRRMGVNLILATQMVLQGTTNSVQQRLTQCGLILYGQPAANRVNLTAKNISVSNADNYSLILQGLRVGEFIATGNYRIGVKPITYPIKISCREDVDD